MEILLIVLICLLILIVPLILFKTSTYNLQNNLFKNKSKFKALNKMAVELQKEMLDENEDTYKEIVRKRAEIEKEGIEIKAKAIKKGLSEK